MGTFTRAVRAGAPVVVGIVSKSGWGKTYSALRIARGLVGPTGRIAGIDTESGRMRLYADLTPFDHGELQAPFSPLRYVEVIREAVKEGYHCIVIDQASFEWTGTGGILELADSNGAKGLQKWNAPKVAHRKFVNALLECPVHIVVCLRGKDEVLQDPKTKEITRTGRVIAQQNDELMYDMTASVVLDREDKEGNALPGLPRIVKCPSALLPAFPEGVQLSERTGEMIAEWVKGGAAVDHGFETLKSAGREAALEGSKALRAWFEALTQDQRTKVKPILDTSLKSAAKAADEAIAMAATTNEQPAPATDVLASNPKAA